MGRGVLSGIAVSTQQQVNPADIAQRVTLAAREINAFVEFQHALVLFQRDVVVAHFIVHQAQVVQKRTLQSLVAQLYCNFGALPEIRLCLCVITQIPVQQAEHIQGFGLLQLIAGVLFQL